MDTSSNDDQVHIFFFPFVGGGHQLPMIDMARLFASHGAKSTIITTPKHSLSFQASISRDQTILHLPISIHTLHLPHDLDISDTSPSAVPFTDTSFLEAPFKTLLLEVKPHCVVHDVFHRWSGEAIDSVGTPRVTFSGSGCFSKCVEDIMFRFRPQESVESEFEPFVLPALPHRIEFTRSQLPKFPGGNAQRRNVMRRTEEGSMGVLINSFYDLEGPYVDHFRAHEGNKAWFVGPVSLNNRHVEDKAERGKRSSIDEKIILDWLNAKEPNSVLYVSFGSLVRLRPEQLLEIACGLEASNCNFIWVVGKIFEKPGQGIGLEDLLPSGFEERIKGKGLVIKGWAPQLLILEHGSVGGFMTHCGWNSTLEGVTSGVPMITWPCSADQFANEKLIVDVLGVGVKVGSLEWLSWTMEPSTKVGRDKVEAAARRLMSGGEEVEEMRRRVEELAVKARKAVDVGGSSYMDVDALIEKIKSMRKN